MRDEQGLKIMATLKLLATQNKALSLNDLRMIVALERIVARIESDTELGKSIVFKGGFVLLKNADASRFTRDIDAVAKNINHERISARDQKNFRVGFE